MSNGFSFFSTRRFFPLFGTQFMGAFTDNLLKTAIVVLISYYGLQFAGLPAEQLVNLAAGLFILPFFLFSATAGKLSASVDKARLAMLIKLIEIGIMLLASIGFFLHSGGFLLMALFMMGTHSAFFGPLKYAILPQYLTEQELVGGNALIETGTFLAILSGQILGSLMIHQGPLAASLLLLAAALSGYWFSRHMPAAPPSAASLHFSCNIIRDSWQLFRDSWKIPGIRPVIHGISWFWLLGAIYTTQLPGFTREHLGGDVSVYTLLLAIFSIGIGVGSILCATLSRGSLLPGMALIGSLGMTVFGADLALSALPLHQGPLLGIAAFLQKWQHWHSMLAIAMLGLFGGFFTVPLYTWLQVASPDSFRSQAIACNNIMNGLYMVGAAIVAAILLGLLHSVSWLFLLLSLANVLALLLLVRAAPVIWRRRWTGIYHGN